MVVFDGTCLVADGASTVRDTHMKSLFDEYHKTKIIVPNFEFKDKATGLAIKALAGTGVVADINDVIEQILIIGRAGHDIDLHLVQLQHLLKDRTECQIVAICTSETDDGTNVIATDLFRTGVYRDECFDWSKQDALTPSIAGVNDDIPDWKLGEGWDSALEIVSFGSALFPGKVGGLLTRYNVFTGVLDHPKHADKEILQGMYNKFRKEEIAKVQKRFSNVKNFINNPTNTY